MKKTSSLKSILIVAVVIVIVLIGYFYYKGLHPSTDSSSLLTQTATPSSSIIGSQVLGLLSQIRSLKIDATLFTDPGYQTLRDYAVIIPPENVGRANPFAALPGAPAPQTTGSSGH